MADILAPVPLARRQSRLPLGRVATCFDASQQRRLVPHRRPPDRRRRASASCEYQPLVAFSGLFRVFADTEPSHDGIKAFADRFGPLGGDIAKPIPLNDQPNAKGVPLGIGEALAAWNEEILTMRFAIDIWEAARNGDVGRLERVIFWTEDGNGVQIISHPELRLGSCPSHRPVWSGPGSRAHISATMCSDASSGRPRQAGPPLRPEQDQ